MLFIALAACAAPASAAVLAIDNLAAGGLAGLLEAPGSDLPGSAGDAPGRGYARPDTGTADPFAAIDERFEPADAAALRARIRNALYAFSYDESGGRWYARNAETQTGFSYSEDGTAAFSGTAGSFGLALTGIGRDGAISPAAGGVAEADGRQLNVTRPGFTEWYRNDDGGVEQGLTFAGRPEGTGPVTIRFAISGESRFTPGSGPSLAVTGAAGNALFTYTGIHATDAAGRDLPSSLATDGTTLLWIVNDTGAAYPVAIDPVIVPASSSGSTFIGGGAWDYFGNSVALSSDGSRVLVGAFGNDTAFHDAGAVYLFEEPAGGWGGTTSASAADATFTGGAASDTFGGSVALSSDGSRVLVGADFNSSAGLVAGAAYLFMEPGGGWTGTTPASAADAMFTGGADWDWFGGSVALSSDGSRALIGAYNNDTAGSDAGAAYLFMEPGGGWAGTTSASAADAAFTGGAAGDAFGRSVALSSDGSRVLTGAYKNDTAGSDAGAAYLFMEPGGGWAGTTSASAADAAFTGSAADDLFGGSVTMSPDGSMVLAGAEDNNAAFTEAGAAYLFMEPGGGWAGTTSASAADATFTGGAAYDAFGVSVALSSGGSRALIGADCNNIAGTDAGAAYLFVEPAGGWTGTTPASAADATFTGGAADDYFGISVALSPDGLRALIGAEENDTGGTDAGAAYLYEPPYATLTAGGDTTGTAGATADGLTLSPTGTLTNIDLYLGTSATAVTGTPVKTGIVSLPASMATTVDGIGLSGKSAGTYYLIACSSGTTTVLSATGSAVYTVTAAPVASSDGSGRDSAYTAASPGAAAGQPMTFAINEPVTEGTVWAIMTVTIVPAGDLGATQIVVTDLPGGSGPGDGRHVAGVFSVVPVAVNPSKIDSGTITFAIAKSWLDQYGLLPEDIVLLHNNDGVWEECPTMYGYESGGVYYFTATTPGFSYFAIASRIPGPDGTAEILPGSDDMPGDTVEPAGEITGASSGPAASSSARASSLPAVADTTAAAAAASAPAGGAGFPFITAALIGAGCVVLAGSGWWVRRWWIRRQNPALYEDF